MRVHAAWVAANAALGYLLVFPALTVVLLWRFVRSRVWHDTVAPFHGAEASAAVLVIVVVGTPLVVLTAWANRRLRRRPELSRWPRAAFWPVTVALLAAPFAWAYIAEPTVPEMLGKGLLW